MQPDAEERTPTDHDKNLRRPLGGSQAPAYYTGIHVRHPTYISSEYTQHLSHHHPPNATLNHEHEATFTSYPESSQRTNPFHSHNPYMHSYNIARNDHFASTPRSDPLGSPIQPDLSQMPPSLSSNHQASQLIPQYRYLYRYNSSDMTPLHHRRVYNGYDVNDMVPQSAPSKSHHYNDDSPEQLKRPPLLLPTHRSSEVHRRENRYPSPSHSDSGGVQHTRSYGTAALDAVDNSHALTVPICTPLPSSIPMRNQGGWFSASPPVASYDFTHQSPISGSAASSSVTQDSDSPVSINLPDCEDRVTPDAAVPPTASKLSEPAKKKKSKMHECEVCGKMFPRLVHFQLGLSLQLVKLLT
ncbi:hypothetical protein H0H81_002626 [Sphagnurus paluster]|uniref:Uncharacterized protein n=1 Tax=Sphagnurus paluster TaxID=117069 RepID=A0A9P7GPI1_9AGAR|nr:hypothetical protein H0H81_002626 [Sphagnurus paluster]